jgi:hypothetical protein
MDDFLTAAWILATSPAGLVAIAIFMGTMAVLAWVEKPPAERGTTTYWFMGEQITRHDYDALRAQGLPAREVTGRG